MAKTLQLDISYLSDAFFEDCALLGIQSKLSAIAFCVELQKKLGLRFKRRLMNDVAIQFKTKKEMELGAGLSGTLFDHVQSEETVYFGVFEYELPYSEKCIYLYENHQNGYYLIPEYKHHKFIILIQDEQYQLQRQSILYWISQLESVTHSTQIDLEKIVHSKGNLIL